MHATYCLTSTGVRSGHVICTSSGHICNKQVRSLCIQRTVCAVAYFSMSSVSALPSVEHSGQSLHALMVHFLAQSALFMPHQLEHSKIRKQHFRLLGYIWNATPKVTDVDMSLTALRRPSSCSAHRHCMRTREVGIR